MALRPASGSVLIRRVFPVDNAPPPDGPRNRRARCQCAGRSRSRIKANRAAAQAVWMVAPVCAASRYSAAAKRLASLSRTASAQPSTVGNPARVRPRARESIPLWLSPVWQAERNSRRGTRTVSAPARSARLAFFRSPYSSSSARNGSAPPMPWQDTCSTSRVRASFQAMRSVSRLPSSSTYKSIGVPLVARRMASSSASKSSMFCPSGAAATNMTPSLCVWSGAGGGTGSPRRRSGAHIIAGSTARNIPSWAAISHGTSRKRRSLAEGWALTRKDAMTAPAGASRREVSQCSGPSSQAAIVAPSFSRGASRSGADCRSWPAGFWVSVRYWPIQSSNAARSAAVIARGRPPSRERPCSVSRNSIWRTGQSFSWVSTAFSAAMI